MLIDQGEMIVLIHVLATPLDGTLICRSENTTQFGWHFTNGGALHIFTSGAEVTPSVSRFSTNRLNQVMDCGPVD